MNYNLNKTKFDEISNLGTVLFKKIPTDTITPVLASLKLFKHFTDYHFLFESAENNKNGGNNKGRFSVIGLDPDLVWKCVGKESFINKNFAHNRNDFTKQKNHPLSELRALINESQIDNFGALNYDKIALQGIAAGIFGYLGYDMGRLMESLPDNALHEDFKIPDSVFIRPQILIIFDNFFDCALICAPVFKGQNKSYDELVQKISAIEKILHEPYETKSSLQNYDDKDSKKNANKNIPPQFNFASNYQEKEFCDAVEKAKTYINSGDIFQVLPSQRFTSAFPAISEFSFYRSLRSVNPSPFLFFLKFDDFVLTGSSPEIMVSSKNKKVTIRPLAGTRKRDGDLEKDRKIAQELLKDEKEIAEHLMLIDLGRHDVGRVAKAGSVKVTEKMVIEYYSHVMHISSNVEGELRDDLDALDALISGFPAGTVSGAPKIRAMEIIEEIEKVKRSFYAGCVGYFASNGDMETCITLRSALIKDGKIYLQSGAGVVFDSDPKSEYQECINKAQALIRACENIGNF